MVWNSLGQSIKNRSKESGAGIPTLTHKLCGVLCFVECAKRTPTHCDTEVTLRSP